MQRGVADCSLDGGQQPPSRILTGAPDSDLDLPAGSVLQRMPAEEKVLAAARATVHISRASFPKRQGACGPQNLLGVRLKRTVRCRDALAAKSRKGMDTTIGGPASNAGGKQQIDQVVLNQRVYIYM